MGDHKERAEKWLTFIWTRFRPWFWRDIKPRIISTLLGLITAVLILFAQLHYHVITDGLHPRFLAIFWPYFALALIFILYHLARTPWLISNDHLNTIALLNKTISEGESAATILKSAISAKDEEIRALKERPPRTPAEQHAYDTVKRALNLTKKDGQMALRHLRNHGTLRFGNYDPQLPPGMTRDRVLWVYNHCASEGIVNKEPNLGHSEFTYSISPNTAMAKALDEALYED